MICWPGQQGDPARIEERLWREARRLCPEGVSGALLLLRPADEELAAPEALIALAAALRPLLRRSDDVIVGAGYAIGVILVGANPQGARVAMRRMLAGLMAGSEACSDAAMGRFLALSVGYGAFASRRPLDRWDADGALRAAARPRMVVVIPYPRAPRAEDAQPSRDAEMAGTSPAYAPRLRVIRRGGRRAGERAPLMLDRSARRLAVGAAPQPLGDDEDEDGVPLARVVRFASAPDGERDRLRLRALAMGVPFLHLPADLPEECRAALAADLARELRAVPIGRTATALTVALDSRWNARVLFRLRAATGLEIFPVLTQPEELERALAQMGG